MKIGDLVKYAHYEDLGLVGLVFEVEQSRPSSPWSDFVHVRFHDGSEVRERSTYFEVISEAR